MFTKVSLTPCRNVTRDWISFEYWSDFETLTFWGYVPLLYIIVRNFDYIVLINGCFSPYFFDLLVFIYIHTNVSSILFYCDIVLCYLGMKSYSSSSAFLLKYLPLFEFLFFFFFFYNVFHVVYFLYLVLLFCVWGDRGEVASGGGGGGGMESRSVM